MSLFWRKKVLLAKIESIYGTDPNPTGAVNAIRAVDLSITPMEGNDEDRNLDTPFLGNTGTLPTNLHQKITFKVELAGSGTAGTAPGWGPLMRACATAETITAATSVVYNPVSDGHESVTLYLNIDGTLYALPGARGTCAFAVSASGIPYFEFEFTALYKQPVDQGAPTPDFTGFQPPLVASNVNTPEFTLDAADFVMRSFKLSLGNQIEPQFLIGEENILITDRADAIETTVRAVPVATFNPFALAEAQTTVALGLEHGTAAGHIIRIDVPSAQMQRTPSLDNAQGSVEWPLRMMPLPVVGNDQWTLTLT